MFFASLTAVVLVLLLWGALLLWEVERDPLGRSVHILLTGWCGLFGAIFLARFVRCQACGERAMLIPDSSEPGAYHQPWRSHCGHCGAPIAAPH